MSWATDEEAALRPGWLPPPSVDETNAGHWSAAAEGHLAVQRCSHCGAHRHPPTEGCYRCGSSSSEWDGLPGTGTVYSYTWLRDREAEPAGEDRWYNVAVIELDGTVGEPVRILSNVLSAGRPEQLWVGQEVELACVELGPGLALTCFRRTA